MVFLFIFAIIILLLIFSKIRIEIENFKFTTKRARHINKNYKLILKLYILGKIPVIKINITKTKLEQIKFMKKIKEFDYGILIDNKKFDLKVIKAIKNLNVRLKNINLNLEIGTENAALTALIVPTISTILALICNRNIDKRKFKISPIYMNQNVINILFSGIFEIKMIHIINIIYILNKKEGEDKNERTSNRRAYDYGYE